MKIIAIFCVIVTCAAALRLNGAPVPIADITQSAIGYFRLVGFNNQEKFRVSSVWYQNAKEKKLFLTIGAIGEPGWMANYWFFKDRSYVLGSDMKCTMHNIGYDYEVQAYNSSYVSYVGTHLLQEHKNAAVDVFAGQVPDAVGLMNVILYTKPVTGNFYGMVTVGGFGQFAFNEYWYGDNSTFVTPPDSVFKLHPNCNNAKL